MTKRTWVFVVVLIIAISLGISGIFLLVENQQNHTTQKPTGNASVGATGISSVITYTNNGFSPSSLNITPGTTITWTNESSKELWVAEKEAANQDCEEIQNNTLFNACESISRGGSFSYTFTTPGKITYVNLLQTTDSGRISVQGDAPAAGPINPDAIPQ